MIHRLLLPVFSRIYSGLANRLLPYGIRVIFDPAHYTSRYSDVGLSGIAPLAHYLWFGAREGRDPHPLFDTRFYLSQDPELAKSGRNPLVHFLRAGWKSGLRPNRLFDATYYRAAMGIAASVNPFVDYLKRRSQGESVTGRARFDLNGESTESARARTWIERIRESKLPIILSISHNRGGGVAQYVEDLRRVVSRRAWIMELVPACTGSAIVTVPDLDPGELTLDTNTDYPALLEFLKACGVKRIHIQHLLGHDLDIHRLQRDLDVPFDFSVHDYRVICPQITLTDATAVYCGEPDRAGCNRCLAVRPSAPRMDIDQWRLGQEWQVLEADRVIAPSCDVALRIRQRFPGANVLAISHPETTTAIDVKVASLSEEAPLRIAVFGLMSPTKGLRRLRVSAELSRKRGLPLEFVLIGSVHHQTGKESFRVTGEYRRGDLPRIVQQVAPDLVWFPAQWPETFSYTLSSCLELGLPVVVPNIGAFVERTANRPWTWVASWDLPPDAMLEFFLALRAEAFVAGRRPVSGAVTADAIREGFYPEEYLEPGIRSYH